MNATRAVHIPFQQSLLSQSLAAFTADSLSATHSADCENHGRRRRLISILVHHAAKYSNMISSRVTKPGAKDSLSGAAIMMTSSYLPCEGEAGRGLPAGAKRGAAAHIRLDQGGDPRLHWHVPPPAFPGLHVLHLVAALQPQLAPLHCLVVPGMGTGDD